MPDFRIKTCKNCETEFTGRNFGIVNVREIIDLCSLGCKVEKKQKIRDAAEKRSRDPATPKPALKDRGPRKLSPSAIKKAMRPKEGDISRELQATLDRADIWNTRTQSGIIKTHGGNIMRLCRPGTPDRIATPGLHVWIEVKRPGEQPSPEQRATIADLKRNGSLAFVIDDAADLDVVLQCLKTRAAGIAAIAEQIENVQTEIDRAIAIDRDKRK